MADKKGVAKPESTPFHRTVNALVEAFGVTAQGAGNAIATVLDALSLDRPGSTAKGEVENIRQDSHGNDLLEFCRINNISVWPVSKCYHTGDFIIQMLGYATFAPTRDEHSVRIGHLEVPDSMVEEAGFPGIQVYGKTLAQVVARALIVARAIVEADAFGLAWTPDVRGEVD